MQDKKSYEYVKFLIPQVKDFFVPLRDNKIFYFSFSRVYKNGKVVFLCTDNDWVRIKFDSKLFDYDGFFPDEKNIIEQNHNIYLYTGEALPGNRLQNYFFNDDKWNSIDLYVRTKNYVDVGHFASTRNNTKALDFYINNLSLLREYLFQFTQRFQNEINLFRDSYDLSLLRETVSENKIVPPVNEKLFSAKNTNFQIRERNMKKNLPKIPLYFGSSKIFLSLRETQCIFYLARGKTSKEVAKSLDISPRTVETYLNSIRLKTGIQSKSTLLDIFFDNSSRITTFMKNYG